MFFSLRMAYDYLTNLDDDMTKAEFVTILKRGITNPNDVYAQVFIDELLQENQARWSFLERKLYVSRAAKLLLLEDETFRAVLEDFAITWDLDDQQWHNFWRLKRYF